MRNQVPNLTNACTHATRHSCNQALMQPGIHAAPTRRPDTARFIRRGMYLQRSANCRVSAAVNARLLGQPGLTRFGRNGMDLQRQRPQTSDLIRRAQRLRIRVDGILLRRQQRVHALEILLELPAMNGLQALELLHQAVVLGLWGQSPNRMAIGFEQVEWLDQWFRTAGKMKRMKWPLGRTAGRMAQQTRSRCSKQIVPGSAWTTDRIG